MSFASYDHTGVRLVNDRISREDGERQERAAADILERLTRQPGVILADEVGMGKTFVALGVAVSTLATRGLNSPVVVMCPSSLQTKWPRDWAVFREKCLSEHLRDRLRARSANSGLEFLRLLDDPPERQAHIIFLTHGAFHRSIGDGWAKLAVIKRAFKGRSSLSEQRRSFCRFAGSLLQMAWVEAEAPGLLEDLMDRPYQSWLGTIHRRSARLKEKVPDDPVPVHLCDALEQMSGAELEGIIDVLRGLPARSSENIKERLADARRKISEAMEQVWKLALQRAAFCSPLLILDEAHHVKNPSTRLASLFMSEEAARDAELLGQAGALGGKFERMLFLTATPFQLGHAELIRVLERFEGVAWSTPAAPTLSLAEFKAELKQLGEVLDGAQAAALRLERSWGRLDATALAPEPSAAFDADQWWEHEPRAEDGIFAQVAAQVERASGAIRAAEEALSPWVLRYIKASHLPNHRDVARRVVRTGAAIRDGGNPATGLEISPDVLLPFLLAGRAQALLATCTRGRALFAEGLSSSFEAYLDTRAGRLDRDDDEAISGGESVPALGWYLEHLDKALPRTEDDIGAAHPKIRATAERAVALWRLGEKVLVFCHYRATGRALRQHISHLLHTELLELAQPKLPHLTRPEVQERLYDLSDRFFEDDRLRLVVTEWISSIVSQFTQLSASQADRITEVVRRFVRTPSFLARYLPLELSALADAFVGAVEEEDTDQHSLRRHIENFCRFLCERCVVSEREAYLDALVSIQTGTHLAKEVRAVFDAAEIGQTRDNATQTLLPNVRLANGEVKPETRTRLLLGFNTPFFPEILIASSVMAEGVDLHLSCRHVIHHDLCWNPSTLEQRSGRVDRIGSKAERFGRSILLYLPYLAGTHDEKMFRVVRDRERWFQVVMGEKYEMDEAATDRVAKRIPLPSSVQRRLTMRLHP